MRARALCAVALAALTACGGGGSHLAATPPSGGGEPTGSNVATVTIDAGPGRNSVNTLFTSVTLCMPGNSASCQTIDHIEVDTASFGLRIMSSALSLGLPIQLADDGNSLVECTTFADGYSWGPVAAADVQIAGELASSLPIQVIGDPGFTSVPAQCSGGGAMAEDTVLAFGANGVLGIGVFAQDCGSSCVTGTGAGVYYSCTSSACTPTTVALSAQVANPVSFFDTDNNGSIIELPSVPAEGALTLTGTLTFGIDTRSDNASGTQTVLTVDPGVGVLTVNFNGTSWMQSFIDSGSNGTYFDDPALAQCTQSGLTDFYCPGSAVDLSATLEGNNGVSAPVDFTVGNAQALSTSEPTFTVIPQLAGPIAGGQSFDFGLPFFYGRRVATALESRTTTAGTGPYIAY